MDVKLPAMLICTAMFMSLFVFSGSPIHDAVDRVFMDTDTGWEEETQVTETGMSSYDPVVEDDGSGNSLLVWTDERTGTPQVFYAKYDGSGNIIVPETRLTKNMAPSGKADMAMAPDGMVTVVFVDGREGNWNIFMKQLYENGAEMTTATQISQIPFGSTVVGLIKNHINDDDAPRPGLRDDEDSLAPQQTVQTGLEYGDMGSFSPSVEVDAWGNAHIVWADSRTGTFELYYSLVTPSGEIPVSELRLTESKHSSIKPLTVLEEDGVLDIVWEEVKGDVTRIMFMRLNDDHNRISETRLFTTMSENLVKDLDMDQDGNFHLAWSDERSGAPQVRYMSFDDHGRAIWPQTALTPPGGECVSPTVAVSHDQVHVAFIHGLSSTGGQIYYKTIDLDTGNMSFAVQLVPNTWRARQLDMDWSSEDFTSGTEAKGRLALVWSETRDGDDNIFLSQARTTYRVDIEGSVVETGTETSSDPVTIMAMGGLFALGLAFATDLGRWATGTAFVPLYSRLKRTEILDLSVRDSIYQRILVDPGVNFTGLMRALKLKNGVLSYHLSTLEREDYIVSRRDGIYRRYYPRNNGFKAPKELHELMTDVIFERPGITQSKLAKALKKSRQVVNYHIKQLVANGTIKIERNGRQTKCYISNWVS